MKNINKLHGILICLIMLLISCKINITSKTKELKYPFLELLLTGYQNTYFQDPENILDMLRYFQFEGAEDIYQEQTIREITRNQSDMSIRFRKGYVELLSGKLILAAIPSYSFKQASLLSISPYLVGVHAFDIDENPVHEKVNYMISCELTKIRQHYSKSKLLFTSKKDEGDLVIAEYIVKADKLVVKNEGKHEQLLEYPYFKEVLDYFRITCKRLNLSRIIFTTRLYFNDYVDL
ncbi:hypothetical protein [Butyricimonas sp. Marseille-P3923]|uniref:hypothetical protein n=1 Tax=Butyricimonas sp. Marseille-P3923 TaxID=1987504 RepID=UPI000C06970F|nr:hypothetical protein [Butyricimonas sp. Marseille-P3923]